jgi:hypothetical protein
MLKEKNSKYFRKYERNVIAGMHLLDELKPGWREKIDRDTFDSSVDSQCILSQLFQSYHKGKEWVEKKRPDLDERLGELWPIIYGFGIPFLEENTHEMYKQYRLLTREWKCQLGTSLTNI